MASSIIDDVLKDAVNLDKSRTRYPQVSVSFSRIGHLGGWQGRASDYRHNIHVVHGNAVTADVET